MKHGEDVLNSSAAGRQGFVDNVHKSRCRGDRIPGVRCKLWSQRRATREAESGQAQLRRGRGCCAPGCRIRQVLKACYSSCCADVHSPSALRRPASAVLGPMLIGLPPRFAIARTPYAPSRTRSQHLLAFRGCRFKRTCCRTLAGRVEANLPTSLRIVHVQRTPC
jgi:hypothetical protein